MASHAQNLAALWEMAIGHATSFGIKAAVFLRIPDILSDSLEKSMSLEEIAARLQGTNIQLAPLRRLLDYLVVKKVLLKIQSLEVPGEFKYGSTELCEMLTESKFARLLMLQDEVVTSGWHHIHEFILHGGEVPFQRAQGMFIWEYMEKNPEFLGLFSQGMVAISNVTMDSVLQTYHGFDEIRGVLVDAGGGFGADIGRVMEKYPHIAGVNYELPHVAHAAPAIPVILVLQNCYKALPHGGKLIIVDIDMDPAERGPFESLKFAFDLVLLALTKGGKERTSVQFIELLTQAQFSNIKTIGDVNCLCSIVEAHKLET
ncbi:desmethylxanthohumol 6'-O-methyltransferase [Selaginella moellendorffii]|uniref:desmethylxanthohumol 6'-O-methyltransferase n=1 Tax=Selaginella moellendorffii TaxID=88036 RepID=UPI000D1C8395|nr:desmethylxanthohumol 6'-O-methyltransferase [Selaginella moellendorffii]|eukprot:XP_024518275.1 desmethylxanthohumol 6'-O-methyltransferase [Selaginella moellendorffii]